jgi:hypothetical protein
LKKVKQIPDVQDILIHDKVRVSDPFSWVSTISTNWYWSLNDIADFDTFDADYSASSYYGVSVDKKGN